MAHLPSGGIIYNGDTTHPPSGNITINNGHMFHMPHLGMGSGEHQINTTSLVDFDNSVYISRNGGSDGGRGPDSIPVFYEDESVDDDDDDNNLDTLFRRFRGENIFERVVSRMILLSSDSNMGGGDDDDDGNDTDHDNDDSDAHLHGVIYLDDNVSERAIGGEIVDGSFDDGGAGRRRHRRRQIGIRRVHLPGDEPDDPQYEPVLSAPDSDALCIICSRNRMDAFIVDCRHACFCIPCLREYRDINHNKPLSCPLCSRTVTRVMHMYT